MGRSVINWYPETRYQKQRRQSTKVKKKQTPISKSSINNRSRIWTLDFITCTSNQHIPLRQSVCLEQRTWSRINNRPIWSKHTRKDIQIPGERNASKRLLEINAKKKTNINNERRINPKYINTRKRRISSPRQKQLDFKSPSTTLFVLFSALLQEG